MKRKLYIGHEALKPIITIHTLEKNIKTLQTKLQKVEINGPIGERLRDFY